MVTLSPFFTLKFGAPPTGFSSLIWILNESGFGAEALVELVPVAVPPAPDWPVVALLLSPPPQLCDRDHDGHHDDQRGGREQPPPLVP